MQTTRENFKSAGINVLIPKNPPVEIAINLYGTNYAHYCTHVAAVLREPSTNTVMLIEYGGVSTVENERLRRIHKFEGEENSDNISTVKLYSDKSLTDFLEAFNANFDEDNYSFCTNNCADAVQFLLNYFFPDEHCYSFLYAGYQLLCCAGIVGSFGLLNCFPAPPCTIVTPTDVYKKAKLLSCSYGVRPENFEEVGENKVENVIAESKFLPIKSMLWDDYSQTKVVRPAVYLERDFIEFENLSDSEKLKIAVIKNDSEKAKALLENGVDVNVTFQSESIDEIPVIFSTVQKYSSTSTLQLLLEQKADVNKGLEHGLKTGPLIFAKGTTLLMYAAFYDYQDVHVLELLCKYGANINAKSESGSTPLHWAIVAGNTKYINFFKSKGVNMAEKNNNGETPEDLLKRLQTTKAKRA